MNGQTLNGTKRPGVPVLGSFTPIHIGGIHHHAAANDQPEPPTPTVTEPAPMPDPAYDPVKLAEADRIRTLAEAEAKAIEIKAAEDARRTRLANDKAERRAREEDAASQARVAELRRKIAEIDRDAAKAAEQDAAQEQERAARQAKVAKSANSWRKAALSFAVVCAVVALPVQMSAFWDRSAPWLLAAPVVLEGGAWVVLRGAAAAVDEHRPHWHYRLIAWTLAFLAAAINLSHGLYEFGTATAVGTAFASLAGPGVWDLHEHGRIRTRDGKQTRRQRRAQRKTQRAEAAERKRQEDQQRDERKAAADAAEKLAQDLADHRAERFEDEWDHALELAAALGETTVTEAVWRRAWRDIHGTEPGDTVDIIRGRNAAARRLAAATSEAPGITPSKVTNAQRASQIPPVAKQRVYRAPARPGRRTKGDSPKFVDAARIQAAITAKNAARKDS